MISQPNFWLISLSVDLFSHLWERFQNVVCQQPFTVLTLSLIGWMNEIVVILTDQQESLMGVIKEYIKKTKNKNAWRKVGRPKRPAIYLSLGYHQVFFVTYQSKMETKQASNKQTCITSWYQLFPQDMDKFLGLLQ